MNDNYEFKTAVSGTDFAAKAGYKDLEDLKEALSMMQKEDILDVDPVELSELKTIRIDNSLPVEERVISLLKQTRNPYFFRYNGMVVKTSFAGKQSIEDCIVECFFGNR